MEKEKRIGTLFVAAVMLVSAMVALTGCGGSTNGAAASGTSGTPGTSAADSSAASAGEREDRDESSDTATEAVTLDVGVLGTSVKPVGVIVADANGYYEEEGVKVNLVPVSSMNDAYLAVSTGDLDIYLFSSTAAATFISQGTTTLRVFGGTAGEGSEIMAAKGSGYSIESADDLVGLTIACQMPETGQMVLKSHLLEQGYTVGAPGEGADVSFVYVNDSSTAIEGCIKGEYDLCITNACMGYYAEDYGVDVVGTVRDFVETYPCCRQTCNQTTYEAEFDALVKFEIATLRGYAFCQNNMDETLDILEAYSGEDRNFLQAQVYGTDDYTPVMRLSLDPNKAACVEFYGALASLGEIPDTVEIDWDEYVVTDVYQSALSTLAERGPENELWAELTEYFEAHN